MAKKREIRCECGGNFEEKTIKRHGLDVKAMVCIRCRHTNFTSKQADDYMNIMKLHNIFPREKKVIRIGNSIGMTFPEKLKELGVKPGNRIRCEMIGSKSFKVEIRSN